jgi:carbonic anhydrase
MLAMDGLDGLFENNRRWVAQMTARDPDFFHRLSHQQTPKYLWIGCSDSRVPANEIVGLLPGELFVHRNVSNVVALDDPNCLSVIQYAVDVLQVRHIIVCGHFGCGGVEAALEDRKLGLSDQWLKHVRDVRDKHEEELRGLEKAGRFNRLCELNVIAQVYNVARTSILHDAWSRQQSVSIHGWIYSIANGLLRDLGISIIHPEAPPQKSDAAAITR